MAEFLEVSKTDNTAVGPRFINPRHVVDVRRAPTDPERPVLITIIQTIKGEVKVEGSPSAVAQKLGLA